MINNSENCNKNVHYGNKCYKSAVKNNNKVLRVSESLAYFNEGNGSLRVSMLNLKFL